MTFHPRTAMYIGSSALLGMGLLAAAPTALAMKIRKARRAVRARMNPDNIPPRLDGVYGTGARRVRLLVLGDSLAAGLGSAERTGTVVANAAEALAAAEGARVEVTCTAKVAARMQDLPGQLERALARTTHFDYALIISGANDVYHVEVGPDEVDETLGSVIRNLTATGTEVVTVTCPNMSIVVPYGMKNLATILSSRLERLQHRAAAEAGALVIPCHPDLPRAVRTVKDFFCSDRFHPSPAGYAAVAEHLTPAMVGAIARVRSEGLEGLTKETVAAAC